MEVKNCCQINFIDVKSDNDEVLSLPNSVEESVQKIIKKEGYKTCDVYKRSVSTDGGNYLAILYEVDIKGKTNDKVKETNLFIKSSLQGEHIKIISVRDVYAKETFVYSELGLIYKELQDEADVPLKERYKIIKSFEGCNNEAIILENIAKKGFKTGHRIDVMPLKFAELAIQQLARFHGLSFVLQRKRPQYYNTTIKNLKTPYNLNCKEWEKFLKRNFENLTEGLDDELRRKTNNFYPVMIEKHPQYINDITGICCLCHGDYRPNNILMKEINGDIAEVIAVDYQLIFYGCPLLDFFYLIFTGTDKQFRKNHLIDLKNLYYDTLTSFLKYFDLDVENIFPRKEFERIYREKIDYGLMTSMQVIPFIFVDDDEVPDLDTAPLSELTFKPNAKMWERIKGIIEDFIEWGYL